MKKVNYWIPVILWAGLIFWFSSRQTKPVSQVYTQDFLIKKTAHLGLYGVLFFFTYRAILNTSHGFSKKRAAIMSLTFIALYGLSDEFHQSFTFGREPAIRDVIIDILGSLFTLFGLWKLLPKMPMKLKNLAKNLEVY